MSCCRINDSPMPLSPLDFRSAACSTSASDGGAGDRWRLTIDADAIEVPPTILSLLASRVERLPDERFIKQTFEGSVTERVLTAIEQSAHTLTLEQLAQRWHMSRRTLHRQLQREGTSFRRLSEQLRRDRAVALLLEGRCQVREIAHQLDMTEPAFSRAFKQWTGMTPLAYRKLRIPPGGGRKPAQ